MCVHIFKHKHTQTHTHISEELWYNETVCLWMTIYIYIYIYSETSIIERFKIWLENLIQKFQWSNKFFGIRTRWKQCAQIGSNGWPSCKDLDEFWPPISWILIIFMLSELYKCHELQSSGIGIGLHSLSCFNNLERLVFAMIFHKKDQNHSLDDRVDAVIQGMIWLNIRLDIAE